jgi:predicted ABC-type exoprotein transport system permease subunit
MGLKELTLLWHWKQEQKVPALLLQLMIRGMQQLLLLRLWIQREQQQELKVLQRMLVCLQGWQLALLSSEQQLQQMLKLVMQQPQQQRASSSSSLRQLMAAKKVQPQSSSSSSSSRSSKSSHGQQR